MLNCFVLAIKKDSFLILKNLFLPGGIFSHHITVFLNKTQKGVLTKLKEQNLKFPKKDLKFMLLISQQNSMLQSN